MRIRNMIYVVLLLIIPGISTAQNYDIVIKVAM